MNNKVKEYQAEIAKKLKQELKLRNVMEVPKLVKIVLNMGLNDAVGNKGIITKVEKQLETITGQKPLVTSAKRSISAFKLRRGMPIGLKVTLRGKRMLAFWEKIVKIVLPRQRDFKGVLRKGFDKQGNLNLGFKEQTLFPDLEYDQIDKVRGLEVSIITSTSNNEHAFSLLKMLGMPFREEKLKKENK